MAKTTEKTTFSFPTFSNRTRRLCVLAIGIVCVLLIASLLFSPFYKITYLNENGSKQPSSVSAIDIFRNRIDSGITSGRLFTIEALILFITISVLTVIGGILLFCTARCYSSNDSKFYGSAQKTLLYTAFVTGAFWISGIVYCSLRNTKSTSVHRDGTSFIALAICIALVVYFAFLTRRIDVTESLPKPKTTSAGARIELFVYAMIISVLSILCALGDILLVKFEINVDDVFFNGLKALRGVDNISDGLQLLAFFVMVVLIVNIVLFLTSLAALIGRSKLYYHLSIMQVVAGTVSAFLIGLFGQYFAIAEKINVDMLEAWIISQLEQYRLDEFIDAEGISIAYDVQSSSLWWCVGILVVLLVMLLRKPYSRGSNNEIIVAVDASGIINETHSSEEEVAPVSKKEPIVSDLDHCPAFTELDRHYESELLKFEGNVAQSFESPTLPGIVNFIVDYARDSRLHLSYTPEDIATFMAGLGATRLSILQGMSGTGKTSLPKIFAEAIMGECDLVEVESSWRDKNELLGYYNEFSKIYTPKKFTCALYRARLFPERPTFIVLDEMNLSRIEYYFSDFLSLMEHEEDRREIRLLGTPIYRCQDGDKIRYMGLSDGTTIKIPANVWFIGTANRDESTFEISDKVYDRAHTMNFNKRAPKVRSIGEPLAARFVSAETLISLFEDAKNSVYFDIEGSPIVSEVEKLLASYNISFGNRIANQIESFVRIYAACFGGNENAISEGLEIILLSKVVAKLEFKSVENKQYLADEFDRIGLARCRDFVLSLNED